jgi:hypothetical protein
MSLILTWNIECHTFRNNICCFAFHPSVIVGEFGLDCKVEKIRMQKMNSSEWFRSFSNLSGFNIQVICAGEVRMSEISLGFPNIAHEIDGIQSIEERKIMEELWD